MKTALVVGASNYNIKYIERIASQYDYIVACDKGAEAFLSTELTPNIIVGDFDSVDQSKLAQLKEKGISIKEYEIEKDFSDLELALIEVKDYD
ncbi:MAG: thiamine diphosphokinase, partial [Ezakiella sp.]|nr:thiamine diphosphokinase [Ezakiella sp.]